MTDAQPIVFAAQSLLLIEALRTAHAFTADESGHAALQGARITLVDDGLRILATDQYKAARQVVPLAPREHTLELDVLLRRWAIEHLLALLTDGGDWYNAQLVEFEIIGNRCVIRPVDGFDSDVMEIAVHVPAAKLPPVVERFFEESEPATDDVYVMTEPMRAAFAAAEHRHARAHVAFRRTATAPSPFALITFDHSDTQLEIVVGFAAKPKA